jgi:hypothetical protein
MNSRLESTDASALRNWLLRNGVAISDPLFCEAVIHTFENWRRDFQPPISRLTNNSPTTAMSCSLPDLTASTAA